MTSFGRALIPMHYLAAGAVSVTVLMGYLVARGYVGIGQHIQYGFFSALAIAFTHAMTMFYFVGTGVSMREAATGRDGCRRLLETASVLRRQMALPLGLAITALMAAVILGGGTHTRRLPETAHHSAALVALVLNLFADFRAIRLIAANEQVIAELDERLRNG